MSTFSFSARNPLNLDDQIAAAIRHALAEHAKPLPDYVGRSEVDLRFAHGDAQDGWHLQKDAARLPGYYQTYARRVSSIPLSAGFAPIPAYWSPSVFFVPADTSMKPQRVYDGSPLQRGVKIVPVSAKLTKDEINRRVFAHVAPALEALSRYRERTGERYEVLYLRQRDRCLKTGARFDWYEYPVE